MSIKQAILSLAIIGTTSLSVIRPTLAASSFNSEANFQEVLPSKDKIAGWQDFVPAWKFIQGAKTFVDFAGETMKDQYRTYHWLTPDEIEQAKCYSNWKEGRRSICNQYPVPNGWTSAPSDDYWACDMYK
jgi:hypothetical protein